jgi:hypothetical protein
MCGKSCNFSKVYRKHTNLDWESKKRVNKLRSLEIKGSSKNDE